MASNCTVVGGVTPVGSVVEQLPSAVSAGNIVLGCFLAVAGGSFASLANMLLKYTQLSVRPPLSGFSHRECRRACVLILPWTFTMNRRAFNPVTNHATTLLLVPSSGVH